MNREIKFRAFDDGKMLTMPLDTYYGISRFFGLLRDDAILMQFTGLLDKNGKEIYEGDIMKVQHRTIGSGENTKYTTFNIPVEFYMGKFYLSWDIPYGKYRFRQGGMEHFEIIGNIYENPELLTNKQ